MLCVGTAFFATLPLLLILFYLSKEGLRSIDLAFFTHLPKPVGTKGGGMANAIVGSFIIVGLATALAVPVAIGGALYLSEYASVRYRRIISFIADLLNSVPSIVWGITAYALIVIKMGRFSAIAGAVALAFIMLPLIMRASEQMLEAVPHTYREAGLALGLPKWKVTVWIVLSIARGGVITAILLAMARVFGETAPLLFTAFGNHFWNLDPTYPMAALPLQIFAYAISPYDEWHRQAWAGALVLLTIVLGINVVVRMIGKGYVRQ